MRLKKDNNDFPFTEKSLDSYIRKVIVKEINDLKSQVIDDVSQNHHRNLKKPQSFLNRVHDLLKFWYEYGVKAIENTKTATLVEKNPKVNLSYGFVKPFLFEDFDFKSILLYVDGMFKHIDEAKKKYTQQDLQDFYLYTLKTAYKTDYNDIDSLLNAADIDTNIKIPDEEDTFNPNIIQDYELFKERIPCLLGFIESIVAIVLSITLIMEPGEHHAKIHMYLLIAELLTAVIFPQLRCAYVKFIKKEKPEITDNK